MNKLFPIVLALLFFGCEAKPEFTITDKELFASFKNNRSEAESKYLDKIGDIVGTISNISLVRSSGGSFKVYLYNYNSEGDWITKGVVCNFDEKNEIEHLKVGDNVTIRGRISDFFARSSLNIEECSLVSE